MADIQLRFLKDMLVLSEPVWTGLRRLGLNVERDGDMTLLLEPEVLEDAYKLDALVGAQCLVAPTATLTPARLAHTGMKERAADLACAALRVVRAQNPQHVLVELGPCGLPLAAASRASLNENCDQYKRAAQLFNDDDFDAFFLNGFLRVADLKCALIGLRKVSDAPMFASVVVDAEGFLPSGEPLREAVGVMAEYGAQVLGFSTAAPLPAAVALTESVRAEYALPILVQLDVCKPSLEADLAVLGLDGDDAPLKGSAFTESLVDAAAEGAGNAGDAPAQLLIDEVAKGAAMVDGPYAEPDDMVDAADALRAAGAQFLRAVGDATPSYTGALVAATDDLDVILPPDIQLSRHADSAESLDDVAARLRGKINDALGN